MDRLRLRPAGLVDALVMGDWKNRDVTVLVGLEECFDDPGIEALAIQLADDTQGFLGRVRILVDPLGSDGIEGVKCCGEL